MPGVSMRQGSRCGMAQRLAGAVAAARIAGRGVDRRRRSPAVARSGVGGEERWRWRGAAARSCCEELGAHARGGVRSGVRLRKAKGKDSH